MFFSLFLLDCRLFARASGKFGPEFNDSPIDVSIDIWDLGFAHIAFSVEKKPLTPRVAKSRQRPQPFFLEALTLHLLHP